MLPASPGAVFESLLALTVEAAPVGIVVVSAAGRIVLMNLCAEDLFGYARGELQGETIERLLPDNYKSSHVHFRNRYMESPNARQMGNTQSLLGQRKDGSQFPIQVGLSPVHGPQGLMIISTILDVSAQQASERR